MDRIKRLSIGILEKNENLFGTDFTENKKKLNTISIIRSKSLKNQVAGYITNLIKKQKEPNSQKTNTDSIEKNDLPSDESSN